jgi:DNA (cytosine-5)-methyltransferase 1
MSQSMPKWSPWTSKRLNAGYFNCAEKRLTAQKPRPRLTRPTAETSGLSGFVALAPESWPASLVQTVPPLATRSRALRELALFAGAGGGILGGLLLGWRTVCAVERDPYCRSVLLARQRDGILPRFPIWDDISTFDGKPWDGSVEVVSGGFPCQDISSSGTRRGITGERSGLWTEMLRVVCEVRPRFVFVENSSELVGRGLGRVLGDLASSGFDARWACIPAAYGGAPQGRDRVWIVADARGLGRQARSQRNVKKQASERRAYAHGLAEAQYRTRQAQAIFRGMDDALAHRLDRLRASGNGQVPAVAELAWETLING